MAIEKLLKPKSEEEFYEILISLDPCEDSIFTLIKYKKLGLTRRLLKDSNVDESTRNQWRKTLNEFKEYVNESIN